jgi:hypothetical protein
MFELKHQDWADYEAPYYLETEYVRSMAELAQIDDPKRAEALLEECWIGTFANDVEMAKHICENQSVEYELDRLLKENAVGIGRAYVKIDYEQFAHDLMLGDVEVLYNLDGIYQTYIWTNY